jgi:DNA topoisomerase-1
MSHLVIVESPAKCQKIQGFLGQGWRVIATMGHIRALQQDLDAVGIDRDFEAKYEWIKEKSKAIKQIKESATNATEIYLASDDDREGEGISYAVCLLLKLNPKTAKRAVFHEITEKAVKHAIAHPRLLDMNRVHAQQTRAILDMLIGFTISPLLWRYVAPSLSAGRCQTPALRLVMEREKSIDAFQATSSWRLSATWKKGQMTFPAIMTDELDDEESAMNYMELVHRSSSGTVIEKTVKPWSESAPPPLITSTLQQQASALFGINPKNTMKIAQKLYEAGHITYMRTDKAILSEEAIQEGKAWVNEQYGEAYTNQLVKEGRKRPKIAMEGNLQEVKAQEAHEAIRPTHMDVPDIQGDAYEKKVYHLIWQRAIQSVMSAAKGESCHVLIQIEGDDDFRWGSNWKRTIFDGWKRAGKVAEMEEEEEEVENEWLTVEQLQVGNVIQWEKMKAEPRETKAQGRYTEATLIRELEQYGIGRPSTFASLLSAIQDRQYIEIKDFPAKEVQVKEYSISVNQWPASAITVKKKVGAEKNKLVPTELGRSVLTMLLTHFDDLFSYGFTAEMEKQLDDVATGSIEGKQVLRTTWTSYEARYKELLKEPQKGVSLKVKDFGNGLKAVQSKKGPLLLVEKGKETEFLGWPKGTLWDNLTAEQAVQFQTDTQLQKEGSIVGTWRDQPIIKKTGKFGTYLQCGEVSIPFQEETMDQTIERLKEKIEQKPAIATFKEYVIRSGQYGPYIMKTSLKKPQFVSLPKGVDGSKLTEKEVDALYKLGMEAKKKWKK